MSDVVASGKVWSSGGLCHGAATRDAMTTKVLTDRGIRALKASRDGTPFDVFDAECPGLAIRVMGNPKRVTKSFVLVARWPGQKSASRRVIGRYGEIGLEAAREQAREWRAQIRKGIDSQAEERRAREEAERKKRQAFANVAETYIDKALPGLRSAKNLELDIRGEFLPGGAIGSSRGTS
jgi:hypothetical protein